MSSNFLLPSHFPICRMHADIRTPTWLCKARAPLLYLLEPRLCFPHKAVHVLTFLSRGLLQDCVLSTLQFCNTCHWSILKCYYKKKKSVYQLLVSFMCCVVSNHPSFLLFRTPLLWGTCHTGDQRNPTGKIATAVLWSRRAFWTRCSPLSISNNSSIFQASPAGTLHHG